MSYGIILVVTLTLEFTFMLLVFILVLDGDDFGNALFQCLSHLLSKLTVVCGHCVLCVSLLVERHCSDRTDHGLTSVCFSGVTLIIMKSRVVSAYEVSLYQFPY